MHQQDKINRQIDAFVPCAPTPYLLMHRCINLKVRLIMASSDKILNYFEHILQVFIKPEHILEVSIKLKFPS